MFKAVVFDVDGTLTDHNSWYAFTRDIGGSEAEHLAIYEGQRNGQIGFDEAKQKLLTMWQNTGNASKEHITKLYKQWSVREEAYPLVKWLKENDYKVCLITGSVKVYAQIIAGKLGVDDYYANADLYFDESGKLTGFHYDTDQSAVKLKQFDDFCRLHDLKPEDCVPIGDSNNDIGLFKVTGNGILITYEDVADELRSSAWKVINNLNQVRPLLEAKP